MNKDWSKEEIDILIKNIDKKHEELSLLLNRSKYSIRGRIRKIKNYNNDKKIYQNNIDWNEVQKFYDDDNMWDDVIKKFKINHNILCEAVKNDKFKTRSISESMKLSNLKSPRKHSQETKDKISKIRIEYLKNNPDKVPYKLNHYSKGPSYPEKYFDDIFRGKFEYVNYLQTGLYHIDFAIIDKKIAIEIDGDQHYLDSKIIESDKRKNTYLTENDWDLIRIKWSDYKKLNLEERKEYINNLIKYIKNLIEIKPKIEQKIKIINRINRIYKNKPKIKIIYNINYCKCGKEIYKKSKMCISCSKLLQKRKVEERPSKEFLITEVKESGYCKIGRKYGVSDNTIRKWLK